MTSRVQQDFEALSQKYTSLALAEDRRGISGPLYFSAEYNGEVISDSYDIEILLTEDYPNVPPCAKECGGKIPSNFHTNPDGTLCLASYLEVKETFLNSPNLVGFTEKLLIPYLYSFSVFQKTGKMPYGELDHGYRGILDNYQGIFKIDSDGVMNLLKAMAEESYRGHLKCPCGSGKKGRECHGKVLLKYSKFYSPKEFLRDYLHCGGELYGDPKEWPANKISKKLLTNINRAVKGQDK